MGSTVGHMGSKTMLLDQIVENKTCLPSEGHIFGLILMKLCQNVCHDKSSKDIENGSCRVKNWVTRSNLRKKKMSTLYRPHEVGQNVCFDEVLDKFDIGSSAVKD